MDFAYYKKLKGDEVMVFFSLLQAMRDNSFFSYRLSLCQAESYIMYKKRRFDWHLLNTILENGDPTLEDPQENLFVEPVNTPWGSFRTFPAFFMIHRNNLSMLLYLANQNGVGKEKLGIVYFLLEISDIIARRMDYKWYEKGNPLAEKIFIPSKEIYLEEREKILFSLAEMDELLEKFQVSKTTFSELYLNVQSNTIKTELENGRHSDSLELHPFMRMTDLRYLVVQPSALLRCAYIRCLEILHKENGREWVLQLVEKQIIQETGFVVLDSHARYEKQGENDGCPYLWFKFDNDKIANIMVVVGDKRSGIIDIQSKIEADIKEVYPDYIIMHMVVYVQVWEDAPNIMCLKGTIAFTIEELKIVMSHRDMALINLYYYNLDKQKIELSPYNQELDSFAYYFEHQQTFYRDDNPVMMMIEIGFSLGMKADYLEEEDIHVVYYHPQQSGLWVHHCADIPRNVPIYVPYMTESDIYLNELSGGHTFVHIADCSKEYKSLCREIIISCLNWMYALECRKGIPVLLKDVYVELIILPDVVFKPKMINQCLIAFSVPLKMLDSSDTTNLEQSIFTAFIQALIHFGIVNPLITDAVIADMFKEAKGRFLIIAKSNSMLEVNDGETNCHYVSKRYCDVVLDEIADFLGRKGKEEKLSIEDSKSIIGSVADYVATEAKELIAKFNTEQLLYNLLSLHHAIVYWSGLTHGRFKQLSEAYAYIGAKFENQLEYLNQYSEMNILTQGLIEYIILDDIHNEQEEQSIENIDRLFALMHFNTNTGSYIDQLSAGLPNSELSILDNGRLALPKTLIDRINSYFYRLRELGLNHPELLRELNSLMPQYDIDTTTPEFNTAYEKEFGLSFEKYMSLFHTAYDYALKNQRPIVKIPLHVFKNQIAGKCLTEQEFSAFMEHYVLQKSLKTEELKPSDQWLQRYNRSVQLTARPWVLFEGNLYFTTKTLCESTMILMERLSNGTIRKRSKEMNSFVAGINKEKGHLFTMNVSDYYKKLNIEGVYINEEVAVKPGKWLNADSDLGDIDILLINIPRKLIVCIEAKDFVESRTVYELIQQDRKIVTKELAHVVRRDEWCKKNILSFQKYVEAVDKTYTVKTIFLTYNESAYNYFEHEEKVDILFLSAIDLIENPMVVFD